MAELLIMANTICPQGWRRGHVVAVNPNGFKWGTSEGPPKFYVVRVPEVAEACQHLRQQEYDEYTERSRHKMPNPRQPKLLLQNRKFSFDLESLSDAQKTTAAAGLLVLGSNVAAFTLDNRINPLNAY